MKNEKMLEILYEVKKGGLTPIECDKYIEKLKEDIALEGCKDNTEKGMVRACTKLLKSKTCTIRPVLKKACVQNIKGVDHLCLTDSYRAVFLKKFIDIPTHEGEDVSKYPTMERLIPNWDSIGKQTVKYKDMNTLCKQTEREKEGIKLVTFTVGSQKINFNLEYLVDMFKMLGSNELEIEFYGVYKPLILRPTDNDNGFGLMVPVRSYD